MFVLNTPLLNGMPNFNEYDFSCEKRQKARAYLPIYS